MEDRARSKEDRWDVEQKGYLVLMWWMLEGMGFSSFTADRLARFTEALWHLRGNNSFLLLNWIFFVLAGLGYFL